MTLPLAVANLRGQVMGVIDYGATEAGVVVLALPCIVLFLAAAAPLRARLHVRRAQGMTTRHHRPPFRATPAG